MAGSAYAGLALSGAGQDVALVAVAARDLPAGVRLQAQDVALQEVVVADPRRYLQEREPAGSLSVPVAAGELVPRSALSQGAPDQRLIALPVDVERLPPEVQRGSRVDVWAVAAAAQEPVLSGAVVAGVASPDEWSGASATVVLAVAQHEVAGVLSAARAGEVDVALYQDPS